MYDQFKTIQYPFTLLSLPPLYVAGLKEHFVDFRLQVYSNSIISHVAGYLTSVIAQPDTIRLTFEFKTSFLNSSFGLCASLTLDIDTLNEPYAYQQNVRVYFDSSDFTYIHPQISNLEGYLCFNDLENMRKLFEVLGNIESIVDATLEPTTMAVIGSHRVDAFKCQSAKPLILQTDETVYEDISDPVSGAVNLVAGANCVVTLQEFSNTVIIAAAKNANGTDDERCGIWSSKIPNADNDVLCDEAVYSIGGAIPDDSGNVLIEGKYPLTVSSLTKPELPSSFLSLTAGLDHIERYIFVGLPVTDSGVNCNIEEPQNPCN